MLRSRLECIVAFVLLFTVIEARSRALPECTNPKWIEGKEYCVGERVTHQSATYKAKWCTTEEPGTGDPSWGAWEYQGQCSEVDPSPSPTDPPSPSPSPSGSPTQPPSTEGQHLVGYYASWTVYQPRYYYVKNIVTSGAAEKLTHILYAFGNVEGGECTVFDPWPEYEMPVDALHSVDGKSDDNDPYKGNFNQLRKLKIQYPNIKLLWSFGGWTLSSGFTEAAKDPQKFANSCYNLVYDSRWPGLFDGIDIDWEYPNARGDNSGRMVLADLLAALRSKFGAALVTAAISGDGTENGILSLTDYGAASAHVDFLMPMLYDYYGAWAPNGPTGLMAPLTSYNGMPAEFYGAQAIQALREQGVPADKMLMGIPFYGRGWTGVSQNEPGGSASGPAPEPIEAGYDDYKSLVGRCPKATLLAGTTYAYCSPEWWSYDSKESVAMKMTWAMTEGLSGGFLWELSGDTADGELVTAMFDSMKALRGIGAVRRESQCAAS